MIDGASATPGQPHRVSLKEKPEAVTIQVVSPDGTETAAYQLTVEH